jgi:carboxymethylenebutenolidase
METTDTNIQEDWVTHARAGANAAPMDAYVAQPEGPGPFPGLIVIHEITGLNENIREIAGQFARRGYKALAVDLFSGQNRAVCMLQIFYGMLISPLKNGVLADLQSALSHLRDLPAVDPARVGVVGFCMGGTFALQLACVDDDLRAASVFYGMNPRPLEAVAQACPIVGSYPEKDFTAAQARRLVKNLEQYQVPHDIKVYPGASHSFFNNRGGSFSPDASADAWARMLSFFDTYIRERPPENL